jgi:uncharacterized protein YdeI (BOF family)
MNSIFKLGGLAILSCMVAGLASADVTMRCSSRLVEQGTSKEEVIRLCGEPLARKQDDTYWFYDREASLNVTRIFFVADQVEYIDEVPRDQM